MAINKHWLVMNDFFKGARQMRRYFDRQFANPLVSQAQRFVWDYWHVPEEYTHLRTPAFHYFPAELYKHWHEKVVQWGREVLGCHDISPPWLSCYVDGCEQRLHQDNPHGPWAYVFSLTPWSGRKFKGGETFFKSKGRTHTIAPQFNRLTVFDPSMPHGVRKVTGTHDPREGRLVVHGWFVQPRPFFYGPLKVADVEEVLTNGLKNMGRLCQKHSVTGYISLKLQVKPNGHVGSTQWLTNTLTGQGKGQVEKLVIESIGSWRFRPAKKGSRLTVPVRFT